MDIVDKKYLLTNYDALLQRAGLSLQDVHSSSIDRNSIIVQSSSGTEGEPLLIPRTKDDIENIYYRALRFYVSENGAPPKKIALFGGISHTQAALKFKTPNTEIISLSPSELEELNNFKPDIISCYPSILRNLLEMNCEALRSLKMIKLGGERVFPSDIDKIYSRLPNVPILEQLGSTEMPAIAFRLHKAGKMQEEFNLETSRFSFHFTSSDGWQDLIVKDNYPHLLMKIDKYYNMGDEVLLKEKKVIDIRRKADPAALYFNDIDSLLSKGCCNVQINRQIHTLYYTGSITLPETLKLAGKTFYTTKREKLARHRESNKLSFFTTIEPDKLEYFFTREPSILEQYYDIREKVYSRDPEIKHVLKSRTDEFDECGDILVIKYENEIIGGARLNINKRTPRGKLLLEEDGISLHKLYPDYPIDKDTLYGEISRIAISPIFPSLNCIEKVFEHLTKKVVDYNCPVMFAKATEARIRRYRQVTKKIGVVMDIRNDPKYIYLSNGQPTEKRIVAMFPSEDVRKSFLKC